MNPSLHFPHLPLSLSFLLMLQNRPLSLNRWHFVHFHHPSPVPLVIFVLDCTPPQLSLIEPVRYGDGLRLTTGKCGFYLFPFFAATPALVSLANSPVPQSARPSFPFRLLVRHSLSSRGLIFLSGGRVLISPIYHPFCCVLLHKFLTKASCGTFARSGFSPPCMVCFNCVSEHLSYVPSPNRVGMEPISYLDLFRDSQVFRLFLFFL